MSLADDIAAAYRAGNYGQVQNWINSSGATANDIQSQFGLNSADMSWLTNNIGLNIPGASPAPAPAPVAAPSPAPVAAPATPAAPSWLTGAQDWLKSGDTGSTGGSYFDSASNKYVMPVYGQGGYNSATGDYDSGALTGWRAYDRLPGNNSSQYSNTPFTEFDPTGKQTGTGQFGEIGGTSTWEKLAMLALAAGGGAVLGGATGLLPASPGLLGSGGAAAGGAGAGTTAAGAGGSSGLYSLSGAGTGATGGLGLSGTAGGLGLTTGGTTGLGLSTTGIGAGFGSTVGTGLGLTAGQIATGLGAVGGLAGAGGLSGTGLQASIGSGLNLFNPTGGGLGLKVTPGDGLNLIKEVGGGLGLKLSPELISNWTTIGKSLAGLGVDEAINRLRTAGLLTPGTGTGTGTGTGSGITINNNNSGGNAGFSGLAELLAGLYSGYSQNQTSQEQRAWMDKQMADVDKLYAPGSPEYNLLMQEMERKDAAAGRNSQYGPRSTDIAAKIAEIKAKTKAGLAGNFNGSYMSATQTGNQTLAGLFAALGKTGTSGVTNLSSILNSILR